MKNKIFTIVILTFVASCTSDFESLNKDEKHPASVKAETLFTNATVDFYGIMNSSNVNDNVFRLYAQYWSQTTYPDESQYNMVTRENPDNWFRSLYRDVLKDLKESATILTLSAPSTPADKVILKNKLAIITFNEIHAYMTLVDLFGNVPYSEALNFENPSPKYDDAKTIYLDLAGKLDKVITDLNPSERGFLDNEDLIYMGDVSKWKKAANSLKLRMALRLADIDAAKSKIMSQQAITSGVISSNDDNLSMHYITTPPYTNPVYADLVLSGRTDFVASNTIVDIMNELEDPRRNLYFDTNLGDEVFKGGIYGNANNFNQFSHLGHALNTADNPGTILSYSEVEFLLAEAVERGHNVGGTAEFHYNKAITASIDEWGGHDADVYLAQPKVKYSTATGSWKQKIGMQKWLSLFNNGLEGWTVWRLMDFRGLNVPDGFTYGEIPVRFIYPINEPTLNGPNVKSAGVAIGGDKSTTKLFFDKF